MRLKKLLLLPALALGLVVSIAATLGGGDDEREKVLVKLLSEGLHDMHFSPENINDDFSKKTYTLFVKRLDYYKRLFTASDIAELQAYQTSIDDEIKNQKFDFMLKAESIYRERIKQAESWYPDILAKPFEFGTDESFENDPDKLSPAKDEAELKDRWRRLLKYQVLDEMLSRQRKNAEDVKNGKADVKLKTTAELEEEARKKILENYNKWAKRNQKFGHSDIVEIYLNAITSTFDPHTNYFAPADKENFDIGMSGKLEGIGAQLREDDGYVKVANVVPGSPSWKQGELKENDFILKVAQGKADFVDCYEMKLDEVVKMIRGAKGTEVRLLVRKPNGVEKEISIIRDVVVMDEGYAKSSVVTDKKLGLKVGFIDLPKFYADFDDPHGRRCSIDVRDELRRLKDEKVDGIILDLRGNGGGSLSDVVDMAGYFIKDGPVVQVKGKEGKAYVMSDRHSGVEWDGPLIIMVDCFAASASEILAAAMQDYGRALIVGDPSTFGKGTVQRFIDLDDAVQGLDNLKPLGSLKITMQKFYRINGGATQLRGVSSDIVLPNVYNYLPMGEKEEDYPMQWNEIPAANYKKVDCVKNIKKLNRWSEQRTRKSDIFELIEEQAKWNLAQKDKTSYSLNYDKYKAFEDETEKTNKKYENLHKENPNLEIALTTYDQKGVSADSTKSARFKDWHKNLRKDPYLSEVIHIMHDMIKSGWTANEDR